MPPTKPSKVFFLAAAAQYVAAVVLFAFFVGLEMSGERVNIHWLVARLYNAGGKWLVAGAFAALGTVFLVVGFASRNRGH